MKPFSAILLTSMVCLIMESRLLAHGDLHDQIQEVTKKLKADPKNAELYHRRGELHRAHSEYPEAMKDYAVAQKLAPALDVVFLSRGRALFESEKFTAALDSLNTFLVRQPEHIQARWLRGQVLNRLGRRAEAEKDFRKAIESATETSPDQFIERARNLEQDGHHKPALAVLEDGMKRLGPLITLELAALDLELVLKDFNGALKRVDLLLEKAERRETFLIRKAEVYEHLGDSLQSQQWYAKALEAIAALPERQRNLKSTAQLEQKVRSRLAVKPSP